MELKSHFQNPIINLDESDIRLSFFVLQCSSPVEENEIRIHFTLFVFHFSISLKCGFEFSFSFFVFVWNLENEFEIRFSSFLFSERH